MSRIGIAVAVIVIVASLIMLTTSDFLVDWAWFSAIGYLNVFWTILGGKALLFCAVFVGSALLLWVNGSLAYRFARRRGDVRPVDVERESVGVQTLPDLLELRASVSRGVSSSQGSPVCSGSWWPQGR